MQITILAENTASKRALLAEHGLSYWIELKGKNILFDTGQGNVLANNARKLGIRLSRADAIALSHGHYDHTGGLRDALQDSRPPLYAHPAALQPKYAQNADGSARDVGIRNTDQQAIRENAEFVPVESPTEIFNGFYVTGPVPRTTTFEDTGGAFFLDTQCTEPDELLDDQSAFIQTPNGTVVLLGCAHSGVINTLRYIRTLTDNAPIHTVMGGMHLLHAGEDRLNKTLAEFHELDVQRLIPCHCTGMHAITRIWKEFPERTGACPVGTVLEIPT